jgi:putative transposase
MCNHVHLLVTPARAGGVGLLMHSLAGRFAGFYNHTMERTGSLWEGRFKSCLVDSNRYLLNCYRYVELNPVRAGVVDSPEKFRWTSYACNALGKYEAVISPHASYLSLGEDAEKRRCRYRDFLEEGMDAAESDSIRKVTNLQRVYGSDTTRALLERELGRPMGAVRRGRPKKVKPESGA